MSNFPFTICEYKHIVNEEFEQVIPFKHQESFPEIYESYTFENVDWEKYKNYNRGDVYMTFSYLFDRMMKGIYISIRNGNIRKFIPFSNKHYKNDWSHLIKIKDNDLISFLKSNTEQQGYKFNSKNVNPIDKWRANNYMLRYDKSSCSGTGVDVIYDMFSSLCENRTIPDVDFFVNRRDFPVLTKDNTEPYYDIWGYNRKLPEDFQLEKWCPILSMSTSDLNSDIPFPTHDDWTRVTPDKTFFKYKQTTYSGYVFEESWFNKKPIAVFRGSSTGRGTTIQTNPRLKVAYLNSKNIIDPEDGLPYLDAGITKWNIRPRKLHDKKYLCEIDIKEMNSKGITLVSRLSPNEQSKYKYIINIDGHVNAFRLSRELSTCSCILLVESEYRLWYSHLLQPWKHYIPIKRDLSDLIEKIKWCKSNDDKCKTIGQNALSFYKNVLSKSSMYDYLKRLLGRIHQNYDGKITPTLWHDKQKFERCVLQKYQNRQISMVKFFKGLDIIEHHLSEQKRSWSHLRSKELFLHTIGLDNIHHKITSTKSIHNNVEKLTLFNSFHVNRKINHKDNTRECLIGVHCVNNLLKHNERFSYTYGIDSENKLVNEHIPGITLKEFIHSDLFTLERFTSILLQVYLSIQYGFTKYHFVHMDLVPWNIIVQVHSHKKTFLIDNMYINTDVSPYIIDYGKSRCLVDTIMYDTIESSQVKCISVFDYYTLFITSTWEWMTSSSSKCEKSIHFFVELSNFLICDKNMFYIKPRSLRKSNKDIGVGKLFQYIKHNKSYPVLLRYNRTFKFQDLINILKKYNTNHISSPSKEFELIDKSLYHYESFFRNSDKHIGRLLPEIPYTSNISNITKLYTLHKTIDVLDTFKNKNNILQEIQKHVLHMIKQSSFEKLILPGVPKSGYINCKKYKTILRYHPCCLYNNSRIQQNIKNIHSDMSVFEKDVSSCNNYYYQHEQLGYLKSMYPELIKILPTDTMYTDPTHYKIFTTYFFIVNKLKS